MIIDTTSQGLSDAARCFRCLGKVPAKWVSAFSAASWAGISTDPQTLIALTIPLDRLTGDGVGAVTTYLLAAIAGGTQNPDILSIDAKCFSCTDGQEAEIEALIFSDLAVLGNDPQALLTAAKSFQSIPPVYLDLIILYSLAIKAGVEPSAQSLADAAKCFRCLGGEMSRVKTFLLANLGGGPPPFNSRITEDSVIRITEDGTVRIIE